MTESPNSPDSPSYEYPRHPAAIVSGGEAQKSLTRLPFMRGELLDGVYEVGDPLGEGGMGAVFEAHDRLLNRKVAIKVSHPGVDPNYLRLESQALASVHHPSLTAAFAFGTHRAVDFLAMERLYGVTLRAHTERIHGAGASLSTIEALDILVPLADGLAALHRAQLAHRDLKPSNVVLAPNNRVVLMDLGLFVREGYDGPHTLAGSAPYMAPEVMTGQPKPRAWHLTDLYSLGVLSYEILTGHRPYAGTDIMSLIRQHARKETTPLGELRPELPAKMLTLISSMLQLNPADRPDSAEDVVRQLRKIRMDQGALVHHDSGAPRAFTVLAVDDDPAVLAVIAQTVKRVLPGARIVTASDGKEALEMVRRTLPNVVFLDLYMPTMSGVEVCMHLRATRVTEETTIVSVSGRAQISDLQLLQELGIVHFVSKGSDLTSTLEGVLKLVHRASR